MSNKENTLRLPTNPASESSVLSKVNFLRRTAVWPGRQKLDPEKWLDNFTPAERPFALNMLNVVLYYNDAMINALFHGTVHQLSSTVTAPARTTDEANLRWSSFLDTLLVTIVEGDPPNLTDSGHIFARKSRTILGISQNQIMPPKDALGLVLSDSNHTVLMVDDFIGSGKQLIDTWNREYTLTGGTTFSFSTAAKIGRNILYAPIIATKYGTTEIEETCSELTTIPAHVLDESYSLISPSSMLWPDSLKPSAYGFLEETSQRAGITAGLGLNWSGFHELALAVAFEHGVPDATMPLYWWDQNGWAPLVSRT